MVNTFITSSSLSECAQNLDNKRLWKQVLEAMEIIETNGWKNHPARLMWVDHLDALKIYCNYMIREWLKRGFKSSIKEYDINENLAYFYQLTYKIENDEEYTIVNDLIPLSPPPSPLFSKRGEEGEKILFPKWFCWKFLHLSHQSSLLRKNEDFYGSKFPKTSFYDYGYLWMAKLGEDYINKPFNFSMCTPIGCGAPVQFRINKEDAEKWSKNQNINPKTGKKIKVDAKTGIASEYKKACDYYKIKY